MKAKETNTYKITSFHCVYIDSYTEGETEQVNYYKLTDEIEAYNWKDAIRKYFSEYLYFKISLKYGCIDEETNTFHYSNLVNVDNIEASEYEIKQWKENKLTLYANNTTVTIQQIIKTNLTN